MNLEEQQELEFASSKGRRVKVRFDAVRRNALAGTELARATRASLRRSGTSRRL